MNTLSQSKAPGRIRTHLLAFGFGVLVFAVTVSASAVVGCTHITGPVYVGQVLHANSLNSVGFSRDDNPGGESYTVSWGDGTDQTGSAYVFSLVHPIAPYTHLARASHTYSAATSGISISLQFSTGEGCKSNTFDVLAPPPDVLSNPRMDLTAATVEVPVLGEIAAFTDSNPFKIASDFTASINWGDGTVTASGIGAVSSDTFFVDAPPGGHAYAGQGSFTVSATLTKNTDATVTSTATGTVVVTRAGQLQLPAPITFPAQQVGTQSATVTLTIPNMGGANVNVSSVVGDNLAEFPTTTTCIGAIAPNATCNINLSFAPLAIGPRSNTITITSDGFANLQSLTSFTVRGMGVAPTVTNLDANQHGLTGSWYDPATNGQGIEVEVFPDQVAVGIGSVFVGWFTFDTVAGGADRQRWYTLSGNVVSGQPSASLNIYQNTGGNFNASPITNPVAVGTAELSFDTCTSGQLNYAFTDGSGRSGMIPLTRITRNVTCSTTGARPTDADFAYSGNWYDSNTGGQGFTLEVNPINRRVFVPWYTYAPAGAGAGVAGQRWYTAEGAFTPGSRSILVDLYETTGGVFDAPAPATSRLKVGTGTLAFQSCSTGTLQFNFTAGSSSGMSGIIALTRIGPVPAGCAQ